MTITKSSVRALITTRGVAEEAQLSKRWQRSGAVVALAWGAMTLLGVVTLGASVGAHGILQQLMQNISPHWRVVLGEFFSAYGSWWGIGAAWGTLLVLTRGRLRRTVVASGLVVVGVVVSGWIMKEFFGVPRPSDMLVGEDGFRYPSLHAAAAAGLWGSVAFAVWRQGYKSSRALALVLFVIIAVVGIGRMLLGVHYPVDVVGGILLAAGWITLVFRYLDSTSCSRRGGRVSQ
ncbi:MAG: hypothetical protein KatS3mg100_100 [Candidatus Parcubacteria bacterium]|nr:MAG: hypothetical protein KatS3mg100_100 [Candidatus Parcubacteria bacterium]